jgi:hypothetical protein
VRQEQAGSANAFLHELVPKHPQTSFGAEHILTKFVQTILKAVQLKVVAHIGTARDDWSRTFFDRSNLRGSFLRHCGCILRRLNAFALGESGDGEKCAQHTAQKK